MGAVVAALAYPLHNVALAAAPLPPPGPLRDEGNFPDLRFEQARLARKVDPRMLSVPYHELPITSFSGWDKVWQVENILNLHDRGYFRDSAMLLDAMMRDDRIASVADTRIGALLASPAMFSPANDSAIADKYAEELGGESGQDRGLWRMICPDEAVGALQFWGRWLGLGLAEILWDFGKDRWTPRLKVWHPQWIYWDWATYRFVVITREGLVTLPDTDVEPHGDGRWFIWAPYGYRWGWLRAFVRRLAHKYVMRGWNYRDWARYNERYGQPIIGAVMPPGLKEEEKQRQLDAIAGINSEAVVPLPAAEDDAPGYDLKLIEAKSRGHDSFAKFKDQIDADISIAVLGWNVAGDTKLGSQSRSRVQDQVRLDKRVEDAKMGAAVRAQVLWWDAEHNVGDGTLAPYVDYQVEPPDDEEQEATVLDVLGDAATKMETAQPGLVDWRAVLERAGYPMRTEAQVQADAAAAQQQAQDIAEATAKAKAPNGPPGTDGGGFKGKPQAARQALAARNDTRVVKRYEVAGLPIAIENPKGSTRYWSERQPDGTERLGKTEMKHDYGYIEGHDGGDGEALDAYVGPNPGAELVHVIHQKHAPDYQSWDEDKVMLGYDSADAARNAYLEHRDDPRAFGGMSTMPVDDFKAKLRRRTSGGKIRARAVVDDVGVVLATLEQSRHLQALSQRPGARRRRLKSYADIVADRAIEQAGRIMGPYRDKVAAALARSGGDFEHARAEIVHALRAEKPDKLADLVRRARIMAHLGGQAAALKRSR
jgi:phage gp29-like protein